MITRPPKPRFAFTVSVIGHRPNRLPEDKRAEVKVRVAQALDFIGTAAEAAQKRHAHYFAPEPAALTLVSALAEGADRMAAYGALGSGFTLSTVLPFAREEYEKDFTDVSSRAEYQSLLAQSRNTVVLCGTRDKELRAYEVAGHTVLDNADLVLAVWDGGSYAGRGGTAELLIRAAANGIPIVHIDAMGVAPTRVVWAGLGAPAAPSVDIDDIEFAPLEKAVEIIEQLVRPPSVASENGKLSRFLDERWRPRNWRLEVPLLLALLHLRKFRKTDLSPRGPHLRSVHFIELGSSSRTASGDYLSASAFKTVAFAFGWADALGTRYAQIFRGAYSLNFLFAALAVFMAALSLILTHMLGWVKWPFVLAEIGFVLTVILNTAAGRRLDWHGRWLEAREVAERFRAGLPLWLLGQKSCAFAGEEPTWTGWYVRAHFRALGLRAGVFDENQCSAVKETMTILVLDQCRYHTAKAKSLDKIEHRIRRIGDVLFLFTLAVALAYLAGIAAAIEAPEWWSYAVTGLTAGLPALGAATYGARLIGDFEGTATRSRRAANTLGLLEHALRRAPPELPALHSLARAAADTMLGDVSRWRVASETRQLAIPG